MKMAAILNVFLLSLFVSKTVTYTQLVNSNTIAVSSTTYANFAASRTVDGNTDQNATSCSHTDVRSNITEAWLRIDLGTVYSVKSVKLWNRGDRGSPYINTVRLRGYSLRVSNDTNVPPPESSCYTDPGIVTLPTIVEEDCERTTRYIWIYQAKKSYHGNPCPILAICEVQVFGCNVGYYGENCSQKCDHCRNNATCGLQNGECDALGCSINGYHPPLCQPCNDGEYGVNCHFNCSRHCLDGEVCNKTDGSCRSCADGYEGIQCKTKCKAGKYGKACHEGCGACVNSTVCNHITGDCELGYEPGWQHTSQCKTACNNGTYGHKCQLKCRGNCLREVCDKTDGNCISCVDGHQTELILLITSACFAIYMLY